MKKILCIGILCFFSLVLFATQGISQELKPLSGKGENHSAKNALSKQATSQEDIDQNKPLIDKVKKLEARNRQLEAKIKGLDTKLQGASEKIESMQMLIKDNTEALSATSKKIDGKINGLQTQMKNNIATLSDTLSVASGKIDGLQTQLSDNIQYFRIITQNLDLKINETAQTADQKIINIDDLLSKTTLWTIIAILVIFVASGIAYWLLQNKHKSVSAEVIAQLSKTKSAIDENLVKEFEKQAESMDGLLKLLGEKQSSSNTDTEPDHSFALKVANEVNIIERNISHMDAGTRGIKQLGRSVSKLTDNLAANGYEVPSLLGKPFHQGMNTIVVNSVPDENLKKDERIITKVLIPQVNYNGKMIQAAQIEVSVGY